jgi:hypothetical protein
MNSAPPGGQALTAVQYNTNGQNLATLYLVGDPGTYQISMVYESPWAAAGSGHAFLG